MIRVDPASPEFELLSKKEQALIYYFDIGWDVPAICDELDVRYKVLDRWLDGSVRQAEKPLVRRVNTRPPPGKRERDYADVCNLFRLGRNAIEIVAELSLPKSTVYHALKRKFGSARQGEAA